MNNNQRVKGKLWTWLLLVLALSSIVVGFLWQRNTNLKKTKVELEDVRLRLKWVHQAQFAGNYVAVDKGFYSKEGLSVELQQVDLKNNTIQEVADGKVEFGISSADDVLIARARGVKIKAIAVIYKINPASLISLSSSKITSPKDLIGKKVGVQEGNPIELLFDAMLESKGISLGKVKKVPIGYDASELIKGQVDAVIGYVINEPDMVRNSGKEPKTMLFSDYGVNIYADVLFTSEQLIKDKPDMITKFLRGTLNGWQYTFENEDEAVTTTMKYAKDSRKVHEAYMLSSSIPLINTGTSNLGWMERQQWEQVQNILLNQKVISSRMNVDDVYTTEFLDKIYKTK